MEQIYEYIKAFLKSDVNALIQQYNDGLSSGNVQMPLFSDTNIQFGVIDPFKNPSQKMLCSIYPESQKDTENDITSIETESTFTVAVICKGELYNILLSQSCRYSNIIMDALFNDYTMNSTVQNVKIGERKFYPDAGLIDKQATAVEIELTVITNTDFDL